MDRNSEMKEPGGIVSEVMPAYNKNLTPFQNYFLYSDNIAQARPARKKQQTYTKLDAFTTAICICTGWLVVAAIIYSLISKYTGGPGIISLAIYTAALGTVCFALRKPIAGYIKFTLRLDLLSEKK